MCGRVPRVGLKALLSYSHAFLTAADGLATAAKVANVDGQVEGMMCVIALQNAVAGAARILGRQHPEVKECIAQVPDLKDVRDMFTHFDDYALGVGRLQKPTGGTDGPFGWAPMWSTNETLSVLSRRHGEVEARCYEVPIHEALTAVARLVAAATDSLGVDRSPLLLRLTADGAAEVG